MLLPQVFVLILLAVTPTITQEEDFNINNTAWNGYSSLLSILEEEGYSVNPPPKHLDRLVGSRSILMVVSPQTPFSEREAHTIKRFVEEGGSLLVADDFGEANSLLTHLLPVSISNDLVLDLHSDKRPVFPLVVLGKTYQTFFSSQATNILLNYSSTIHLGKTLGGVITLATTGSQSWLDSDLDNELDKEEPTGPFPVMLAAEIGDGRVVVISDPSMFINDMIDREDNKQVLLDVVTWLATGGKTHILIDTGHTGETSIIESTTLITLITLFLGIIFFLFLYLAHFRVSPTPGYRGELFELIEEDLRRKDFSRAVSRMNQQFRSHIKDCLQVDPDLVPPQTLKLMIKEKYPKIDADGVMGLLAKLESSSIHEPDLEEANKLYKLMEHYKKLMR